MTIFQLLLIIFSGFGLLGIVVLIYEALCLSRARQEEVWGFLVTELNKIVGELGSWNEGEELSVRNKKVICRMLHDYLDGLREIIAIEPNWLIVPWRKSKRRQRLKEWYLNLADFYDRLDCYDCLTIFHPDGDPYKNVVWRNKL